jgi:hypothetical protein
MTHGIAWIAALCSLHRPFSAWAVLTFSCQNLGTMQESNGEVLRLPVMSKKMTMAGELEVTGSVAGGVQPGSQVGG